MYRYELEKGSKKFKCPGCGNKTFTRTFETATGNYLPDYVGRCDREANCGYQYTWKQYFDDNPEATNGRFEGVNNGRKSKRTKLSVFQTDAETRNVERKPDYLEIADLLPILTGYENNTFVEFLHGLFPNDPEDVFRAVKDYLIGTKDGFTVFPTISKSGKFCKAKLIKFNLETGKRIKDRYSISSLEARLKRAERLKADFETDKNVFFGEHLLRKYPDVPIAIVEAEKSAVIGSICNGVFPDVVWLATGSLAWLKWERLIRLGHGRRIVLFPDTDTGSKCYAKWLGIASEANKRGSSVNVSDLLEKHATADERANGYDIADYLIHEQARRNESLLNENLKTIIEERLAIMTIDGGLTETEAKHRLGLFQSR